jgi:hypothetical protein
VIDLIIIDVVISMCTNIYICVCGCMSVYVYVCVCACVCMYVGVYVYVCGEVLGWVMAYFCTGRRKDPLEIESWPG